MNCIITLKINDYFPKLETIPFQNFVCLFSYGDFKGKIALSQYNNDICIHEINKINSDIKYIIHILESDSGSLIGMCELLIPLIKFRQINPPCTLIQEQKLKVIIDTNTRRKLFKTLINSSDIYIVLHAEIFVPSMKNIEYNDANKIEVTRTNKNINRKNRNNKVDSPRTNKKKKIVKEIISNKEMIKNDLNISYNKNNRTINYENKNNSLSNKSQLMNAIKNSFKKIDEINLSSKSIKRSKINQKRSPKKRVTILELMEQKMQPLLLNINEDMKIDKEKNMNKNSNKKINIKLNKTSKKLSSPFQKNDSKRDISTLEKHSSTNHITSKNSNEFTSSNNKIKRRSSKGLSNRINQPMDEINMNYDINKNLYNINFNKDKFSYDKIRLNKSREHSILENDDINSNYGILSTDERTEQVLSGLDKIILEKSTKLRDLLEEQIKNINHKKFTGTLYIKEKRINQDMEIIQANNIIINKSSLGTIYNNTILIPQEKVKNNYLLLIDLYRLLSQKLSKTIYENIFSEKKLSLLKEEVNHENKKINLIKRNKEHISFNSLYNINLKHKLKSKIVQQLIYTKNLESKLYQNIFNFDLNDYEIIRQKEIERVNKLNEGRKYNILLKIIKDVIFDIGNVSQIFNDDIYKQNILKQILENNNIKEKEQGVGDYVNLWALGMRNKFNFEKKNYENNIITEVDEDKEEESEYYSSNKKKNQEYFSKNILEEIKRNSNVINDNITKKDEINENENNLNNNIIKEDLEENKKIDVIKDMLINKFNENKKFEYIKGNEFLFDNKYNIKADLLDNNEIIIEIDNNKYNLNSFRANYCQKEIINVNKDIKNDKKNFIYTKKIMTQNEHKKHRRKKRILDESEDNDIQNNENIKEQ